MEDDVNFYIEKEKSRKVFSADEINLIEYRNKYTEAQKNLKNLNDVYEKYSKTETEQKFKLKNLLKKFENYGGLNEKDKFAMRSSLEMMENTRKENMAIIKNFLEDDVVFYLNAKRIMHIKEEVSKEKPKNLLQDVDEISEWWCEKSVLNIRKQLNDITDEALSIKYRSTPKLNKLIDDFLERYSNLPIQELKFILKSSRDDLNNTKLYKQIIGKNESANSKDLQNL